MIKLEKTDVYGWEVAIRGMRNPMNSWEKMDSGGYFEICPEHTLCDDCPGCVFNDDNEIIDCGLLPAGKKYRIGPNDHKLMMSLAKSGTDHAKFRRMIMVSVDITAPLYWWKEFDTYKVGTVANSCSTMHKISEKKFTLDDFSCEHLMDSGDLTIGDINHANCYNLVGNEKMFPLDHLRLTIDMLNMARELYLESKNKDYWWQMIQLLPTSYNQKRTVMLNYEVLANIYPSRKNHKLDEWHTFCDWIEKLPYSEIITGGEEDE